MLFVIVGVIPVVEWPCTRVRDRKAVLQIEQLGEGLEVMAGLGRKERERARRLIDNLWLYVALRCDAVLPSDLAGVWQDSFV